MNGLLKLGKKSGTVDQESTLVSVAEYRKILNDYTSSEEHVIKRLQYLEAFCCNIIRIELQKYVKATNNQK